MYDEKYLKKYAGSMIKKLREKNNITQDELAEALNLSRQAISRYELGDRGINQNLLFKMSNYFKVPIDEFFPKQKTNNLKKGISQHLLECNIKKEFMSYYTLSQEQMDKVLEYIEFIKSKE